jgi:hypothetical protein
MLFKGQPHGWPFSFYTVLIMASLSFPALPSPIVPSLQVGAVAAAMPVALLQEQADALPLPQAQPAPSLPAPADAQDGAAMRPDQVIMARQLVWPSQDGGTLATSWRGMVRSYGTQLAAREQQARTGQLPAALLLSGQLSSQDIKVLRQADQGAIPADAWRFTVHAGGARDQHLRVVQGDPDETRNRRRRGRAALRLELVLADGTIVTVQAEPIADGVLVELCARDQATIARLQELQPQLEAAIRRAGLRVLAWRYRDTLPEGRVHARLPSAEAASALSLQVFHAMAELALLLPAGQAGA